MDTEERRAIGDGLTQLPELGEARVLVLRASESCSCWCATGEGEAAPLCAAHHNELVPVGEGVSRRAFALLPEREAVAIVLTHSRGLARALRGRRRRRLRRILGFA